MSVNNFWQGPFGIRADEQVYQVPSTDGVNWVARDGKQTELRNNGAKLMDEQTYLAKYGTKCDDGHFWYIPKQVNCCGGDGSRPACCRNK